MDERLDPGPVFHATFDSHVRATFKRALSRAYASAVERHDPGVGSNEQTFGYCVYHYGVFELSRNQGAEAGGVVITSTVPCFRFHVGDFELACHRVGSSEHDDIWSSFPNADSAAHAMHEQQLWLPSLEPSVAVESARKLVLAHVGNAEDGLRAIYLCAPAKTDGKRIVAWAFAQTIWRADGAVSVPSNDVTPPGLAPEERVEEPMVRRKVKQTVRDEEG